ncbi:MAG: ferredoxin--NADP reductase [Thiohalocapsa sp.]|jgi:ferredoxin--NADP+ reductase|uniref:ferredoxin--NADP reductase n=1 Tax=Thiohalocapsa sp. TaxID=2497641 RepID=UPI0025CDC0F0|nr:ferredoxin--NADP reductase [Thiohalocapsa sp.]MCG6942694.1 ferredoxin--NADP reductase [Thiohalocapsa sp.]
MAEWLEGKIAGKRHWSQALYSLQIDAPLPDFTAGQYIKVALDVDGERVGRPYSLVNAPAERPLEIYFNEIPEGPLTPKLSDLEVGDRIWVSDKASGVFTLDNVVSRRHLWMLATGTALGVYLSMLKTADPWERFERVILVHGARNAGELSYGETIAEIQAAHEDAFTFITTLTRDSSETSLMGRITNLLENGALQAAADADITPEDSHLMLCGNSAMIKDVRAWLEGRGMQRHKRHEPGNYTTEQYH